MAEKEKYLALLSLAGKEGWEVTIRPGSGQDPRDCIRLSAGACPQDFTVEVRTEPDPAGLIEALEKHADGLSPDGNEMEEEAYGCFQALIDRLREEAERLG